ncbi:MAG: sigma factor-like helix-turn-helix DNA-binding protein [Candidatus Odinarchaeota archaeon]
MLEKNGLRLTVFQKDNIVQLFCVALRESGLKYSDISRYTGIKESTIRSHVHRWKTTRGNDSAIQWLTIIADHINALLSTSSCGG